MYAVVITTKRGSIVDIHVLDRKKDAVREFNDQWLHHSGTRESPNYFIQLIELDSKGSYSSFVDRRQGRENVENVLQSIKNG